MSAMARRTLRSYQAPSIDDVVPTGHEPSIARCEKDDEVRDLLRPRELPVGLRLHPGLPLFRVFREEAIHHVGLHDAGVHGIAANPVATARIMDRELLRQI